MIFSAQKRTLLRWSIPCFIVIRSLASYISFISFLFVCSFVQLVFAFRLRLRLSVKVVSEISFACRDRASE